jgi:DNA-binding LacI/PurR family transcriptional regulator
MGCTLRLPTGSSRGGQQVALFSSQNLITLGTVRALRASGAQHRTAVVGFDDLPLAGLLDPPVTSSPRTS